MRLFLGLDGGGTKTASVILTDQAEELGRGRGGPCNIATCSDEQLRDSVSEARSSALAAAGLPEDTPFEAVCAGVAGYTAKRRRAEFAEMLKGWAPAERHRVEPDFVVAYWGATEGEPGIIVSAGTGAVVYGRNERGDECREDGRGFLLGDRGSAFDAGRFFLRRLALRLERKRDLSPLDRMVMEELGVADLEDLIEWAYRPFEPAKVASVCEVLARAAARGDQHATVALSGPGMTLRMAFYRVRVHLGLPHDVPVYLLGSLWKAGSAVLDGFHRGIDQAPPPPAANICTPRHDPAYGAALLALKSWPQGTSAQNSSS